jgi:hypothetical protein
VHDAARPGKHPRRDPVPAVEAKIGIYPVRETLRIQVHNLCTYKGDVYLFSFAFYDWLENQLGKRIKESEAFTKEYGKGWTLILRWDTGRRIKKPRLAGPWIDRKCKWVTWEVDLPAFRYTSADPKAYVPMLREVLRHLVIVLNRVQLDASRVEKDIEHLLKYFTSRPKMLEYDPHILTVETLDDPYELKKAEKMQATPPTTTVAKPAPKFVKRKLPKWKIPKNIQKRIDAEDGMWEDERFDPILLTVMSGTSYRGRKIPLAWQIEFDPSDEHMKAANQKLEASSVEPDGDGWAEVIEKELARHHPIIAGELHSDSESSTCVLWVESENACKKLIELVWSLIYAK